MAYSTSRPLFGAYALLIFALLTFVSAQQCYTPAGTPTLTQDLPCGNGNNACCPQGWLCTDIGLCYKDDIENNPFDNRYERKTCTKQFWDSSCPNNYCTDMGKFHAPIYEGRHILNAAPGGHAGGNEVVRWCPDQSKWCCAGNGKVDCCKNGNRPGFSIDLTDMAKSSWVAKGINPTQSATSSAVASTSATPTTDLGTSSTTQPTSRDTTSASSEPSPTASQSSSEVSQTSSAASQSSSAASQSFAPAVTVIRTDVAGSTVTVISTPSQTSTASSSGSTNAVYTDALADSQKPSASLGMIVGLAVGVPLVLLALGLLGFACWRRRRNNKRDSDVSSIHPFYSDQPPAEKVLEIPDRGLPPASDTQGPAEMQGSEPYTQRYPVKTNPFQNRPDLLQPPEHNEAWSRETTMMTLPGAENSGGHENVSPDTGSFSPPYSPVSSQSVGYRPNSYSEFSPNIPHGPWGQAQEGGVRPVEMEGSRISTIAELPAETPTGNQA